MPTAIKVIPHTCIVVRLIETVKHHLLQNVFIIIEAIHSQHQTFLKTHSLAYSQEPATL